MENFTLIIKNFEDFIKRSILPSASFMLFLLIFDIVLNKHRITIFLDNEHSYLTIGFITLAFIGLTNLLSILQQSIYDNRLKENFNGVLFWKSENNDLEKLRLHVNKKLFQDKKEEYKKDYDLYQIIGKSMEIKKEYVNQAKSFGIMMVSLMIVTFIYICTLIASEEFSIEFFSAIIFIGIVYLIGKDLVKSRYRSRARRIYQNYLND